MSARMLAWIVALACVVGVTWFVLGGMRVALPQPSSTSSEPVRAPQSSAEPAAESVVVESVREALPVATSDEKLAADDEEEPDPPTPARPGSGQALLRVAVVALETEKPLAGAQLRLTSDDENHEWVTSTQSDPSRGVENDEVIANVDGRGEFVVKTDFAYTLQGGGENGLADDGELVLAPFHEGEEREVRLALPTAWTRDWYGQVLDGETKLPIAGAEVEALATRFSHTLADMHVLASAMSPANGHVMLRLPAWESVCVRVRASGYFWGVCPVQEDPNTFDDPAIVELRRPSALDVRVLGADGAPASAVEVRFHTAHFGELRLDDEIEWRERTDADGRCLFAELPPGVELGLDVCRGERVLLRVDGHMYLEPGERHDIELHLPAGCRLTGVVHDHEGRPMERVPLVLTPMDLPLWTRHMRDGDFVQLGGWETKHESFGRAQSDEEGRFAIDGVGAGSWALGAPGSVDLPRAAVVFEIAPAQPTKEIELEIDRGLSIRGLVLDPEGKAVREGGVSCVGKDPSREQLRCVAYCSRDGSFDLGPLLAGAYALKASPDDPLHAVSANVSARAGDRDVVLRLRWGGTLGGSVMDGETGEAASADVSLSGFQGGTFGSSDGFEFERLLPGSYDLVARTEDGRVGVLTGIRVNERERKDDLVIPVRHGAMLHTKTQAPEGYFYRVAPEWEGIALGSTWGDLEEALAVPPGHVVVHWYRLDKEQLTETLVHEEDRTVELGQDLTLEADLR